MRRPSSILLLFFVLLTGGAAGSPVMAATAGHNTDRQTEQRTVTYRPQHRTPQALIQSLRPLFGDSARFSTDGTLVLIRSRPATLKEIHNLLPKLDHPAQHFRVQLSDHPTQSTTRTYSTTPKQFRNRTLDLMENETVTLAREQRVQTVSGGGSLLGWQQVSTLPTDGEFIRLRINSAEQAVYLTVQMQTLNMGKLSSINKVISGKLDQWIPLIGPEAGNDTQVTVSTQSREADNLYVKISAP